MAATQRTSSRGKRRPAGVPAGDPLPWLADLTPCQCGHERLWHQAGRNFCCYAEVAPPVLSREPADGDRPFWMERHEPITGDGRRGQGGYDFGKGVAPRLGELVPLRRACTCERFERRPPGDAEPVGARAGGPRKNGEVRGCD
jgi:hypothetical protein